ncbi:MAG: putative acetyltransferase [Actinomycetia bacterium]|nr:putative acetyltransferase [Actinomycetes bacterium]
MGSAPTNIRLIEVTDAEAIAEHVKRDAEALTRWEPARQPEYYTPEGQAARIGRILKKHDTGELWPAVVLAADGAVIGQVTVQGITLGPLRKGYLGYWIGSTHEGMGHATRAVGLILGVMREELRLHRAEAFTQIDNVGSERVLRRNGFGVFGVARSHIFIDGQWRDQVMWELILDGER